MPKMKTHKGSLSRFKVTATGKLKRNKQGRRHILTKKTSKRKRHLKQPGLVDSTMVKKYARMMGVVK